MGSLGNKVLSFVLASTIALLGQVDCVPLLADLKDFNQQSNEAAVTKYFTVHQVTQLVRRRRDNVDHVQFPDVMTFDLEFEDSKMQLKLTKHDFMTGGVPLYDENGPIEHNLERKTGVYNSGAHGASFIVTCEDYYKHCTLQGSMMFGDKMWNISPDRNTEQLHKAVMRQNSNKKEFAGVLPPNRQGMEYEPKPQTDRYTISNQPSSRQRRAVPTDCDLVEAYAITDAELWRSYLSEESGNTTAAEAAIHSYFLSLYHQADRHFDLVSKIRNDSCIRLYLVGVTIQKTNAESWSIPAEITIPGAIPAIAFVEAIDGLNSCGAIGNGLRGTLSISVDLFQCFTRKDIVWNENSGIPAYLAFYRSLAYKFSVCNPLFGPYQSDIIETLGDDVEVLLAKQIAGSLGTDYDSLNTAKGCSDNDYYVNTKETVVAPDVLKQRNVWYLSTCALDSIAAYLDSESVKCLRTSSISDAEYDAFFNQALAGTIYTWEKQCQNRFGENSTRCDPTGQNRTFFDDMCSAGIMCTSNEFSDGSCTGVTRPFEGTPCGTFGSYCLKSECYILHGLGENCTAHERCSANNSFCDNLQDSTCRCIAEFYDDNGVNVIGGDCLPKVDVGEPCPQSDACLDTNAICIGSQVCECLPGFYTENGKCFKLLCFGDSCNNTYQCQGDKVECLGLASTCRCNDDDYFDVATGNCVDKLQLGAVCEPGQCLTNYSVCGTLSGQCECQEDFYDSNKSGELGGTCDPKIPLDAPCPFAGTCLDPNAECTVNCTCKSDFYDNAGTCEPKRSIGETCVDVTACSTSGAECSGTPLLCQCPTGKFLNETTNSCDTNKVLGESCIPGSCGPANSVCDSISNVCECQEGFYDSNNVTSAGTCEAKISLDAPCPFAGTCVDPNAECIVNCTCKSDFYDNAGTCEPQRCIGETCVDVTACSTSGAECSGTPLLCQCPTGTFLNETTNACDTNKVLGESCIPGSCGPANSVCDSISNVCECQEGFFDSNNVTSAGTCESKIALDAPCPFAGTCLDPNAECTVNCTCNPDFYDNAGTCEPKRCIGETCVDVTACSTSGAECSGTPLLCQCPTGSFLNETTNACDTNKVLGESCIPGLCGPANSVCSSTSNVCECQEGFYDSNNVTTAGGTCDAKISLDAPCPFAGTCLDPNAECIVNCTCKSDFYDNAGTCEPKRCIGETCVDVTACSTSGAECSGTPLLCQCPTGTFLNETTNACDTNKVLGESCIPGSCGPANSVCDSTSNVCECQEGFYDSNNVTSAGTCEAKISLDAPCPFAGTCLDPNAKCIVNCTCKSDFYDNAGTCEPKRCIGETCVDVTACSTPGAECSGTPLLCQCPTGTFLNETTNVCDTNKVLGESCIPGSCGPANSVCDSTSNVCECQEGFYDSNNVTSAGTCESKIVLDAPCPFAGTCLDPNAACTVNCTCKPDFYDNAGTCEPKRCIGESCVDVTACSTSGVECSGTPLLCQCPTGTFLNETTNVCNTNKVLGESCIPGSCGPANSVCDSTSNVCECQEGFYDSNNVTSAGTCESKIVLDAPCPFAGTCLDPNAECTVNCTCKADFYDKAGTCEPKRCIGETCVAVTACSTSGAECSGTPLLCQCPTGTFLNETTNACDTNKVLGESCIPGSCGPVNSVCDSISNVCECQEGFYDSNNVTSAGTCEAKISLDATCPFVGTCLDPNAECTFNCTCKSDFYDNTGTCEPKRCIGESCVDVTACSTSGAECSGTPLLCQCPTGTFLNETTNACDTNKLLGEVCIPGSCGNSDSVCSSTIGRCLCQEGFYRIRADAGDSCNAKLPLGANCSWPDACSDRNAECSRTCQCLAGFYNTFGFCTIQSCIGESCVDVTACSTSGAECSGTPLLCQCPAGTFLNETTNACDTKKDLNESCIPGSCGPANSVCSSISNMCACQGDFFDSNNLTTSARICELKISLDAPCPFAGTCLDPNAECTVNCTCKSDFYDNTGTCEPKRSIGGTCVDVAACSTSGAECSGTPLLCQCPSGTFFNETTNACDTSKGLFEACLPGSCGVDNSVCSSISDTCQCQEDFFSTPIPDPFLPLDCFEKIPLSGACGFPGTCLDSNAECFVNNVPACQCVIGFYNNAGFCRRQRNIGEECNSVSACFASGAECSGTPSTCRCPSLTFLNDETGTCDAAKALGDNCTAGQCGRNAICTPISGTCVCGDGFADTNGNGTCEPACPGNFVLNPTLGSCYLFGTDGLLYSAARDFCSSFSTNSLISSLVQVDDSAELTYLKSTMLTAIPQPTSGYWNDLFQVTTNGNERWRTTNTSLADTISDWGPDQPDDQNNELQQCTMFFKNFNYEQADVACLDDEFPGGRNFLIAVPICEIKLI